MLLTHLAQVVAHHEPRLARTNDDSFDLFLHALLPVNQCHAEARRWASATQWRVYRRAAHQQTAYQDWQVKPVAFRSLNGFSSDIELGTMGRVLKPKAPLFPHDFRVSIDDSLI